MEENLKVKISSLIINEKGELLICRKKGKDTFISLGGKVEGYETDEECLRRELKEEAGITPNEVEFLIETPKEEASGEPGLFVIMKFYIINDYEGEVKINPNDNVEEFKWISKEDLEKGETKIASGLPHYAIPELINRGLMGGDE